MAIKVITGTRTRINHCHLFDQFSANGNDPAFSVMAMVPKADTETVNAIRTAERQAAEEGKDKFGGKVPPKLASIWKDGDDTADEYPEQAGHIFAWITKKGMSRDVAPPVLDVDGTTMFDSTEIYSGCYAQVSMEAFAYNSNGNKGITFGLRAVKKVADGERLGPTDDPAADFETSGAGGLI